MIELRDVAERRTAYDVPEEVWAESAKGTLVAVPLLVGLRVPARSGSIPRGLEAAVTA